MNRFFFFFVALLLVSPLLAQTISIDDTKASVNFLFLDDDVDGTFSGFIFTGDLDLDNVKGATISGSVATETIDTDNWLRDRHLRRKYFKAADFPQLTFKSTSVSGTKEAFKATGSLTIKGVTRSVSFQFTNSGNKLIGKATINAHDFDIVIHKEKARNKLNITLSLPYTVQ